MNTKKLRELITERNCEWESADRNSKKMLICKDVLKLIKSGDHLIGKGQYCREISKSPGQVLNAQQALLEGDVSCQVCARGAMMLSKMRFVGGSARDLNISGYDQDVTTIALVEAFSDEELDMIESVFERIPFYRPFSISKQASSWPNGKQKRANEFARVLSRYSRFSSKRRLRQLMERIVEWNGDVEKAVLCGSKPKLKIPQ